MIHAYLVEFKSPDGWIPREILFASAAVENVLSDCGGDVIHHVRWRRLRSPYEFQQYVDQGCAVRVKPDGVVTWS